MRCRAWWHRTCINHSRFQFIEDAKSSIFFSRGPSRCIHDVQLLFVILLAGLFERCQGDPSDIKYPTRLFSTVRPCSCDCCQVSLRLPSEVERLSNGIELRHKCTTSEAETEQCPNVCDMTNDEQVLTSALGQVDYQRFCLYKCTPSAPMPGTMCQRQAADESWVARVPDGNGRRLPVGPATWTFRTRKYTVLRNVTRTVIRNGSNSTVTYYDPGETVIPTTTEPPSWEKAIEEKKEERKKEVIEEERKDEEKQKIIYDYRKLVAERLRAQAGAMASHEIATGERVRLSEHAISRNAELLARAAAISGDVGDAINSAQAQVVAEDASAIEAAAKSDELFRAGKASVGRIMEDTRRATMSMVQQGVQEMAREEAESFAQRMFWDKPINYGRVLSYRAAVPYQTQMIAANQQVAEYERAASQLHDRATSTQQQAEDVAAQIGPAEGSGKTIEAVIDRRKARNLLRKSRELQRRSDQLFQTAQAARSSVHQWWNASWVASIRTDWKYNTARTQVESASPCATMLGPDNVPT